MSGLLRRPHARYIEALERVTSSLSEPIHDCKPWRLTGSPRRRTRRNITRKTTEVRCRHIRHTGTISIAAGTSTAGMSGVSCTGETDEDAIELTMDRPLLSLDLPERPCLVSLLRRADRVTPARAVAAASSSSSHGCTGIADYHSTSSFLWTACTTRTAQAHKTETHVTDPRPPISHLTSHCSPTTRPRPKKCTLDETIKPSRV